MAIKHSQTTPAPASDVSRRKFLQSVIAASAATGAAVALPGAAAASIPAAAVVATGDLAAAAAAAGAFLVFSDDEAALFSRVANRLIPPQGLMPGAGDIGLTTFVDGVLADAAHLRQPILDILQLVQAADDEVSSGEGLDAVLARIQQAHPVAFTSMLEAVYTAITATRTCSRRSAGSIPATRPIPRRRSTRVCWRMSSPAARSTGTSDRFVRARITTSERGCRASSRSASRLTALGARLPAGLPHQGDVGVSTGAI